MNSRWPANPVRNDLVHGQPVPRRDQTPPLHRFSGRLLGQHPRTFNRCLRCHRLPSLSRKSATHEKSITTTSPGCFAIGRDLLRHRHVLRRLALADHFQSGGERASGSSTDGALCPVHYHVFSAGTAGIDEFIRAGTGRVCHHGLPGRLRTTLGAV